MKIFSTGSARVLLCISILFLASCRLVIFTNESGHIISASGLYDCDQAECAFEIEELVRETFTAVPAEGKRFVRWTGVCSRSPTEICEAIIIPLSEEHQHLDGDVELRALFESANKMRPWYLDEDGDHFGDPTQRKEARQRPEGYVMNRLDCDDDDPSIRPHVRELDDGLDNNCNGNVDEGFADATYYRDGDGDGFGNAEVSQEARQKPAGFVENALDCNDEDASINPEAREIEDDIDNNCDGNIDGDLAEKVYFRDVDGDGFGVESNFIRGTRLFEGYALEDGDCDDSNADISPAARETFDSVDNDCDGLVDEGFAARNFYRDEDEDGYGDREDFVNQIEAPDGYVGNGSDNCVEIYNPEQSDVDRDGIGDACDAFTDSDGDEVQDSEDNCPNRSNRSQSDEDEDGIGDACDERNDLDPDNDRVNSEEDNCPNHYNPTQADRDEDGRGDACDAVDDREVGGGSGGSCSMSGEDEAMLAAVNAFRSETQQCGSQSYPAVSPLSWNCQLKQAALVHSMDMANENFMAHTGSDGSSPGDRITEAGYSWSTYGENVAAGYSSVSSVVQGWANSAGHCRNMMNANFRDLGAAKYSNSSSTYGVYWTQAFGRSR